MEDSHQPPSSARLRIVLGVLAALVLALFALQSAALMEWLGWRGFGKVEHVRLGAYAGDVGALEWIAKDRGFYDKVGLDVEVIGFASGKEAAEALKAGQVDVATASEFVVATRSFAEPDLRILGSISYYRNKGIVARRDRAIASPVDLKGKRIGVTAPSGAEYALYVFLALHGLGMTDVTTVNLGPTQLVAAVEAGSIDAAITWQPHVQDIQTRLGAGAIGFEGDGFDTYLLLLTRQQQLSPTDNRAFVKLLRALVLAEEWVAAHPAEAKAYVAARFKLDAAYVDTLWPGMQLEVRLPQELLAALDGQARWLAGRDGKPAAAIPNYAEYIRANELKSVRPSAVTLISAAGRQKSSAVVAGN